MSKFKFTIDSSTATPGANRGFTKQKALLSTSGGYDTPGKSEYDHTDSAGASPSRSYKFMPAGSGYAAYALVTSKTDNKLADGTYVFNTNSNTLTSGAAAEPADAPERITIDTPPGVLKVSAGLTALVGELNQEFAEAPPRAQAALADVTSDLSDYFLPGFEVDALLNSDREDAPPVGAVSDANVISALTGKFDKVRSFTDILDTAAIANPDLSLFLIQGTADSLAGVDDDQAAQLKVFYANFKEMTDYLAIPDTALTDVVAALAATITGAAVSPAQGETSAAQNAAASPAGGTPPPGSYAYDGAKAQILDLLGALIASKPDNPAVREAFDKSDFALSGKLHTEILSQIERIKAGTQIVTDSPVKLADNLLTAMPKHPVNAGVFAALKAAAPDKLAEALKLDQNADARALLAGGAGGTLAAGTVDKALYDNCVKFADYIGIKSGFIAAAKGTAATTAGSGGAQVGDAVDAAASGLAAVVKGATTAGDAGSAAATTTPAATTTTTAAEPAPEADPGQTIGFFVTIFGAAPSTPALIQIEFDRGIGDNTADTYDIGPIQGTKFDKRLAVQVRNPELIEFWKANTGTDAQVRITAVPASGGDAITVTREIPIKWPLRTSTAMLPAEVFRFSETVGRRSYSGVPADEGRGGAKDDSDKQADVAQLYYTQSGGIRVSTTPARVDAVGRTYRFTFDPPMLVPVEIAVPKGGKLEERVALAEGAVPHWIFLAGRRGSGEGPGGGGGGRGAAGQALNIAVSGFAIKTTSKWIAVPNVGAVWDKDTFRVKIAPVAAGGPEDKTGLAPILGVAEIRAAGLDMDTVERAVLEACFGSSAAWSKLGAANNCWAKDPSVTGPGGVTARQITYKPGGSA